MDRPVSVKDTNYDPDYWQVVGHYDQVVTSLLDKMPTARPDSVDMAFKLMGSRMIEGVNSMSALERLATHNHYRDTAILLRALYDLHIQFLYLLTDPPTLSLLYLNYNNVELFNHFQTFNDNDSIVGKRMKADPNWPQLKARVTAGYMQVKAAYEYTRKGKVVVRKHWHEGQLDVLATRVNREAEYRVMHKVLSGIVHSSAASLRLDFLPDHSLYLDGWRFAIRVVGGMAKYLGVPFDKLEQKLYESKLDQAI